MAEKLRSDRVVVEAPMSFAGSAKRIWHWTWVSNPAAKVAMGTLAVMAIVTAWSVILCWYLLWGVLVVPFRLFRRHSRSEKAAQLRHRELMKRQP